MKTSLFLCLVLLLVGCKVSRQEQTLTPEQAMIRSVQLANTNCDILFQKQPFQAGKLPQFTAGHWVWRDSRGVGGGDMEATVDLAADGWTNKVEIKVLDNKLIESMRVPQF